MHKILVAALLVVGTFPALVLAQEDEGYVAMQQRIARDRMRSRFLRTEETSIIRGLRVLEKEIRDKRDITERLISESGRIESELAALDTQLEANSKRIQQMKKQAGLRALAMHRIQRTRLADLLRHARDPGAIRRLRDRLKLVLSHDAKLISAARTARAADTEIRGSLTRQREALTETHALLERETESALLLREQRAALLGAIRSERRTSQRLAMELARAAKRLEKERGIIRGAEPAPDAAPGGFAAQKGRLPWPTVGEVEVTFGKSVDPESGMVVRQSGLDIRAPRLQEVRAVFPGKIVHASRIPGFGNVVIVEHDAGYHTVHGHLESIRGRVGRSVRAYEVVGLVGDTGSEKGPHLYFEVREGARPLDPLAWLSP